METLDFLSSKTWSWCKANNIELKGGEHAKVGDIVICSYKGEDFENPGDLGTVLKVCKKQKLVAKKGEKHPDGTVGHIFVLTYKKQKKGAGNLSSKSILF